MAAYALHLLGPPRLQADDTRIHISRRKTMALLAYLAVTDRAHTREALATLLWPESDASSARAKLRQGLSEINRYFEPVAIEADRNVAQLSPDLDLSLDVVNFRQCLESCPSHTHEIRATCPECLPLLTRAVALYRDHFMAGFTLEDSAAFDDWQFFQTEALKDEMAAALVRLATYYTSQGDFDRAIDHARRWLAVDPLHEPAHRHLMVLYARSNQRAAALRQYETCCRLLQEELGVEPSARTQEAHNRLLSGEILLAPTAVEAILERELRTVGPCPYRGLAAFAEADAPFFFGREAFVGQLTHAVATQPLVAMIVGASGSGKSSVIFAGLLPRLREEGGWTIGHLRPTREPFQALAGGLLPLLAPDLDEASRLVQTRTLSEALVGGTVPLMDAVQRILGRQGRRTRLLLLVDQFEELYTLCPDPNTRRRFIDTLLAAVDAAAQTEYFTLLLTLRADFMGQALAHRPFADALQIASQMLGPMTRVELGAAIEKPAQAQGAAFEAGLVERLLDDVANEPGNLPLLEFALTLLWERLDFGWLTHAAYEQIGRVAGALARYAQQIYAALSDEDQHLCRRIFTQLVQPGEGTEDTRRVASRADVGNNAWGLVQHLADRRLVVTGRDELSGTETVEVVHEALIQHWDQLQTWMAEDRTFRTWQERLRVGLRTWENTNHDDGALLRGVPLAEAKEWLRTRAQDLSEIELVFVETGLALRERRASEREAQRQRELESARQLAEAHDHALQQAAIGLAAEARNQMQGPGQDVAVLLALEAVERYPYTWQAERALAGIVRDYRLVWEFRHGAPVDTLRYLSPDGARFLAATHSGVLRVFDLESGQVLLTVQAYRGKAGNFHRAEWAPSGDRILTSTWGELPRIWDAKTGDLLAELAGHGGRDAEWSPDGKRILSYNSKSEDAATVWDAQTGQVIHTLPGDQGIIKDARFSPDGRWIATSIGEIWDAATGTRRHTLTTYRDQFTYDSQLLLSWSPKGGLLGSGIGNAAHVWEAATGDEVLRLHTGYQGRTMLWWSPGADLLLTLGTEEGAPVILWHAATGEEVRRWPNAARLSWWINPWSTTGDCILLPDSQGRITVWDVDSHYQLLSMVVHAAWIDAAWLPDSSGFITAGGDKVRIWRLSTAELSVSCRPNCPVDSVGSSLGFARPPIWSPTGDRVARHYAGGTIQVWDMATGAENLRFQKTTSVTPSVRVHYIAWSPDGSRIATTAHNGDVDIWDSATGERLVALPGHDDIALSVCWSPDGQRLLSCSRDHKAIVWDATTGDALTTYTGQDFKWGAWSPDGKRVALVDEFSYAGAVKVWDAESGEALLTLLPEDFAYGTSDVAWSPDGTRLVTLSQDKVGRVWDAGRGNQIGTFNIPGAAFAAEWSPSGSRFLVSGTSGIRVWDAATLQQVGVFPGEGETYASWSPDGSHIAISYYNGDLKIFPAWQSLEELVAYAKAHCVLRDLTPEERTQFGLPER